jgi:hypothetical protein
MPVLATVFAATLAHLKQEKVLPLVIMAEVLPQSQNPLGFQVSLAVQVQELSVALTTVFVPAAPQMKQPVFMMIVFARVVQGLQAFVIHLSVDRVHVHPPEPSPAVALDGHWVHKLFYKYAIE